MKIATMAVGLMLATAGVANAAPPTLCTGGESGNYHFIGQRLVQQVGAAAGLKMTIKLSTGSMANLEGIAGGACDVAFTQADALYYFKKERPGGLAVDLVAPLYEEYVHFICNREAKIEKITELTKDTIVAIGPDGSGANVTWRVLTSVDPKRYGQVPTRPLAGIRALSKVAEGGDATCMIFTAGLKTGLISKDATSFASKLKLVRADDSDFNNLRDDKKRSLYSFGPIPGGTYKGLQEGFFSSSVPTAKVRALLVVREEWVEKNDKALDAITRAVGEVMKHPDVTKRLAGD